MRLGNPHQVVLGDGLLTAQVSAENNRLSQVEVHVTAGIDASDRL